MTSRRLRKLRRETSLPYLVRNIRLMNSPDAARWRPDHLEDYPMARWKVRAVRELHFETEVDARTATDAGTKVGDMIRAGTLEPVEKVISDMDVFKLSSS